MLSGTSALKSVRLVHGTGTCRLSHRVPCGITRVSGSSSMHVVMSASLNAIVAVIVMTEEARCGMIGRASSSNSSSIVVLAPWRLCLVHPQALLVNRQVMPPAAPSTSTATICPLLSKYTATHMTGPVRLAGSFDHKQQQALVVAVAGHGRLIRVRVYPLAAALDHCPVGSHVRIGGAGRVGQTLLLG